MKLIKEFGFYFSFVLIAYILTIFVLHPFVKSVFYGGLESPPTFLCKNELTTEESILSCIINSEAAPNDTMDAYYIGSTVLNRIEHKRFPDCVHDVVFQNGQYDGVNGRFYRSEFSDTIAVRLMNNIGRDCSVLFFYNFRTATDQGFISSLKRNGKLIYTSKNHKFYGYEISL